MFALKLARTLKRQAVIGAMLAFTLAYYWPFLDPSRDWIRVPTRSSEFAGDLTPEFGVYAEIWREALKQLRLPSWNPYIMGGQPFLALPGVGLISPEKPLLLLMRGQLAARLSIPLALWLGWLGLLCFFRRIGLSDAAAFCAGLLLLFNPGYMGYHAFSGHVHFVYAVAYLPWLLWASVQRPGRRGLWMGLVLGLTLQAGAGEFVAYLLLFGAPAWLLAAPGRRWLEGGQALVLAFLLSAPVVLPAWDFLSVSNRMGGIDPACGFFQEYHESWDRSGYWLALADGSRRRMAGWPLLLSLGAVAAAGLARLRHRPRLLLALLLPAGLSLALAHWFGFYRWVWGFPLLSMQRIPQRGLMALYASLALAVGLGLSRPWPRGAVTLLTVCLACSALWCRPDFPSLDRADLRLSNNRALQTVARDRHWFRLTSAQDTDRNWGWEDQAMPLGLRLLLGYARLEHADMLPAETGPSPGTPFLPACLSRLPELTGLLGVRYVLSTHPLQLDGLRSMGCFEPSQPAPLLAKSRGPYLYRNLCQMPRAYTGTRVVGLVGQDSAVSRAGLALLLQRSIDLRRVTLVYLPEGAELGQPDQLLAECPELVPPVYRPKLTHWTQLAHLCQTRALAELPMVELTPEHLRVEMPSRATGTWLVLSEKLAMFHGWQAHLGSHSLTLRRCNHVNTALWVPPGPKATVDLTYSPPGFWWPGSLLFGLGVLALGVGLKRQP